MNFDKCGVTDSFRLIVLMILYCLLPSPPQISFLVIRVKYQISFPLTTKDKGLILRLEPTYDIVSQHQEKPKKAVTKTAYLAND